MVQQIETVIVGGGQAGLAASYHLNPQGIEHVVLEQASQAAITVIRARGTTNIKYEAAVDFPLEPGDIVQIGSLFPMAPEMTADRPDVSGEKAAEGETSSKGSDARSTARIN